MASPFYSVLNISTMQMQLPSLSSGNLEACVQAIILHLYQLADHTNTVIVIPLQYFTYSK